MVIVKSLPRVAVQRAAVYLGISIIGMAALVGVYCLISGRSPAEALGNLWIAILIAFIVAVSAALRDQRAEDETHSETHRKRD